MSLLSTLVVSLSALATPCIEVIPGKSLGELKIGQKPPAVLAGQKVTKSVTPGLTNHRSADPYFFRLGDTGLVEHIQYSSNLETACFRLRGKSYTSFEQLKAATKKICIHDGPFKGSGRRVLCDGFSSKEGGVPGPNLQFTPKWQMDVGDFNVERERSTRAGLRARYELEKLWPFKKSVLHK